MNAEPSQVLQTSTDPKELTAAAVSLAGSEHARDHELLAGSLVSKRFLESLNTEEEYEDIAEKLRVRRVLEALARNKAESAREVIARLTKSTTFCGVLAREVLLLHATAVVRPPPAEVQAFWKKKFNPESAMLSDCADTLLENQSPEALELFEQQMLNPAHEESDKLHWLRSGVLTRRNRNPILQSAQRLLKQEDMPLELRQELLDVLFDYKPQQWYRPASVLEAPSPTEYGVAARTTMQQIGRYCAANLELRRGQEAAIEETLKGLKKSLQAE